MRAILRDAASGKWRLFERPQELIVARLVDEVIPALRKIEAGCATGLYAAGFVAYEAAGAFDPALRTVADGVFPLVWFGLYDGFHDLPEEVIAPGPQGADIPQDWTPSVDRAAYMTAFDRIQEL